jgi:polyhydroxybutyrate depolymerase
MPLLVSLHPFTLDPANWEELSGLADAAVARGYVVVTPLGSQPGPRWAVPGGLAGITGTDKGTDDLGFLAALLDTIEDGLCVDRNREFAAGYSAGAAMSQALSCTMPWRFAAVAGSGGVNLTSLCPASPPTDVFVLHGTADTIAPLTGSQVPFATPLGLPVADVVATDAARAGCDPAPTASTPVVAVEALTFGGCDGDHRVQYWRMLGAGHAWAGANASLVGLFVGRTPTDFSATEAVLDFFDAA